MIEKVRRPIIPSKVPGKLVPLGNSVLATDMNFEMRITTGGIIIPGDDGKNSGIRPRWCKVYAVGPEQKDVSPGQWILVSHGRWTRGLDIQTPDGQITTVRKIDTNEILAVSDEPVVDDTLSDKVT
jgi:co-chaperonin GroES (HSP10)